MWKISQPSGAICGPSKSATSPRTNRNCPDHEGTARPSRDRCIAARCSLQSGSRSGPGIWSHLVKNASTSAAVLSRRALRPRRTKSASLAMSVCGKGKHGRHILGFEIVVVVEDVLCGHAGTEQVENRIDRVAQPAYAGLAVTDRRVGRDAVQRVAKRLLGRFFVHLACFLTDRRCLTA